MNTFRMVVEIPIKEVPDNISIQEARVTSEYWLFTKIPDAKLLTFEVISPGGKVNNQARN